MKIGVYVWIYTWWMQVVLNAYSKDLYDNDSFSTGCSVARSREIHLDQNYPYMVELVIWIEMEQ